MLFRSKVLGPGFCFSLKRSPDVLHWFQGHRLASGAKKQTTLQEITLPATHLETSRLELGQPRNIWWSFWMIIPMSDTRCCIPSRCRLSAQPEADVVCFLKNFQQCSFVFKAWFARNLPETSRKVDDLPRKNPKDAQIITKLYKFANKKIWCSPWLPKLSAWSTQIISNPQAAPWQVGKTIGRVRW